MEILLLLQTVSHVVMACGMIAIAVKLKRN
jgi:hypothetical protein